MSPLDVFVLSLKIFDYFAVFCPHPGESREGGGGFIQSTDLNVDVSLMW